ncbi:MAG: hypothetical protein COU47_03440 [Candidatus Niyogibacteria bacterium CG10_big_fil_rev_8_21_14_0_10_46_36]|uniref:DUF5652 domain-containing protein n=1 Tax=Candidatus Niyogibacteria bacterium CG10_big_fil_rev_8_21_14_0_10_46_36 TaxID=1974726 RepID=A0A2H0TCY2_9BACT|nr:MAG: hypothetical protein COU47_03440 [Candidatus Niyogibacteria bacterium CG10_big_fil_rev_8_21_14_0_10_46_36]
MIGGISQPLFIFTILLALWTLPWKGFALWRAAHRNDKWWFVVFLIVNTAGILEIVYLIVTRKKNDVHADASSMPSSRI